ncbi:hypothetical protein F2P81_019958 [Scophthalmus maximus]|nr:hypothetical protein F2P81_019958 [Scophthalmus maximus]
MEDPRHDWTPLRSLIAPRHIKVPAFRQCGHRSRTRPPAALSYLQVSENYSFRPCRRKQRQSRGFEEVGERCCNPYNGREDTAGHSAPAQSSSFCNQLPECCAS